MRKPRVIAALTVLAAAFGVRFAYLHQISTSPFFNFLQLDPLYYFDWAKRIAAGDWLGHEVFEMSPLYSYLLAAHLMLFGEDLWLLRVLQIGVGSISCLLTFLLGCRLFGTAVGLVAGLGCAVYGPFLFYEGQVMKEFLTPPLATGALLLLVDLARKDGPTAWRRAATAGALLGLAALVRDNFLVLAGILGLWLVIEFRGRLTTPLVFAAGILVVLTPAAIRNVAVAGEFVLTTAGGGEVFYIGNGPYANGAYVPPPWVRSNPRFEHEDFRNRAKALAGRPLSRAESSRFWWREGLTWIAFHPGRATVLWARKIALFWNDHELPDNYSFYSFKPFAPILYVTLSFGPIAALAWAGALLAARQWRLMLPAWIAAGGYMASVVLFFNFARFRLPLIPILLVFAAHAIVSFVAAVKSRAPLPSARRLVPVIGVMVAVLAFSFIDWSSAQEEPFQDRLHLGAAWRQAGRPEEAERVFREVIADAEAVVRRHGGDPSFAATTPGGITFVLALSSAWQDLAGALTDLKRPEEALAALERAANLSPDDASLLLSLAAARKASGNLKGTEAALRRAVSLDPALFVAGFDLATLLHESGRDPEALEELGRAMKAAQAAGRLGPLDRADYHYGAGIILSISKESRAAAAEHFLAALKLNPAAPQAGDVREALREMGIPTSDEAR